jgi:hypothetical protein
LDKINYLSEPILNSELVLINNAKKLKKDNTLLNEKYLDDIKELRKQFLELESKSNNGEIGLQKEKRDIRDKLRKLSVETYTPRDNNLFGDMITMIVNRIASRPQFSNYTYINDMKSLAIEHILLYTYKFDPFRQSELTGQYASAFAYISTIAFNAFIATINSFNKEQKKAKEQFLEKQKLIHKEPNVSTYGPDYSEIEEIIELPDLKENELYKTLKHTTILKETKFLIPKDYIIDEKTYNFITKYDYNISIGRLNG